MNLLPSNSLTVMKNDSGSLHVNLVPHQNDRVASISKVDSPQVAQDVLGQVEAVPVHHRVDNDAGVGLVSGERVFNLTKKKEDERLTHFLGPSMAPQRVRP